jgi:Xaa-Pro aminopeptidase
MVEQGIDALVMQASNDWLGGTVRWFTDVPACNGYPVTVIFPQSDLMSVVEMGPFEGHLALDGSDSRWRGASDVHFSPSFTSVVQTADYDARIVGEILARRGYRKVGLLGGGALPRSLVDAVDNAVAGRGEVVDATDMVDRIKAIKSDEEVALIRQTAAMQDAVFSQLLKTIRPGMRDVDVAAAAWHHAQTLGSEQGIILGGSAPLGEPSTFVGRHFQGRTLTPGDHLSVLIEVNGPGGYYTEIARTIVLGQASNELLEGFAAVHEAQNAALRHMRPGTASATIAAAHDSFMQSLGLPTERRLFSHGQGQDMVERPLIRRDEPMKLQSGMCVAVHPGYETRSQFAVICDNYLIGPEGPGVCLHATEKKIFEV